VTPPELRAKQTVFIRQIDTSVGQRRPEDIKQELERNHDWLTVKDVIKIKDYTHMLKIQCSQTTMATKILQTGLLLFNTRVTPGQCELETYTYLQTCFKCYKYETHTTSDCKTTTKVCSECAQTGHTHLDCTSTEKHCLNCPPDNNNHRTLATQCPYRKKTIKDKEERLRQADKDKRTETYSAIAKQAIKDVTPTLTTPPPAQIIKITTKTQLKMTAIILESHVAALSGHGKFNTLLSESLKLNYDIDATFPDRNSQKIFNLMTEEPLIETETTDAPTDDSEMDTDNDNTSEPESDPSVRPKTRPPQQKTSSPKKSTPKKKRKATSPALTTTDITTEPGERHYLTGTAPKDPRIYYKFYRSDRDHQTIPDKITSDWILKQIKRTDDYGLKLITTNIDPDVILDRLKRGQLRDFGTNITTIAHNEFMTLNRAIDRTKRRKESTSSQR